MQDLAVLLPHHRLRWCRTHQGQKEEPRRGLHHTRLVCPPPIVICVGAAPFMVDLHAGRRWTISWRTLCQKLLQILYQTTWKGSVFSYAPFFQEHRMTEGHNRTGSEAASSGTDVSWISL
jgi:hypothetical protein